MEITKSTQTRANYQVNATEVINDKTYTVSAKVEVDMNKKITILVLIIVAVLFAGCGMYAYNQAKAAAEKSGDKVSQQGIAESVLDQMGFDNETKRLFWQMTGSNWAERNNPF